MRTWREVASVAREGRDVQSPEEVENRPADRRCGGSLGAGALWFRSYWSQDVVYGWLGVPGYFQVNSSQGCLKVILNCERQDFSLKYNSKPPERFFSTWNFNLEKHLSYGWWLDLSAPHYIAVIGCALFAAMIAWV